MTEKERLHVKSEYDRCRESCGPYQFSEAERIAIELEKEATDLVGKCRARGVSLMFFCLHKEAGLSKKPTIGMTEQGIRLTWCKDPENIEDVFSVIIDERDRFVWYDFRSNHHWDHNWLQQFTPEMIEAASRVD